MVFYDYLERYWLYLKAKAIAPRPLVPRGPWRTGRVLFVSWALPEDNTMQAEADKIAYKCAELAKDGKPKFSAIAVENTESMAKHNALLSACDKHGLVYGVWADKDDAPESTVISHNAKFYIANVEGPGHNPVKLSVPRAIVTNFGGVESKNHAAVWKNAGYDCMPECYVNQNPQATIANQRAEAKWRGWAVSYPVIGVYGGYPLASYPSDWSGVYTEEEMSDADWNF
jgi:hypothetical protein